MRKIIFKKITFLDLDEDESEKIIASVKGQPSWINDSTIIYSKISLPDKNGSKFIDI